MTDSERVLKQLSLNFKPLVKNTAWEITPKGFLAEIKIILIENVHDFEMFIWDLNTETVKKSVKFDFHGDIANNYSFLYNFNIKNLKDAGRNDSKKV